jgi:phosphomannomutase
VSEPIRCFKSYDVRGRIPDELNENIAQRIGRAYAEVINPGTVVVGHDIRLTSRINQGSVGRRSARAGC